MRISAYTLSHIPSELFIALGHYRRKVFIELLGWDLAQDSGLELDQFDSVHTVYLIAQDDSGSIVGCARLLPTTRPYLLSTIFPQLMKGDELPGAADVWELSRFAALDLRHGGALRVDPFSAPLAVELLQAALHYAAEHEVRQLVAVSPVGVETLLHRAGFQARRTGTVQVVNGHRLMACRIDTQPSATWKNRHVGDQLHPGQWA
ncbi:acyl-homoserine-lactone synthase [Pseudomonas sp. NA-150]|uniref:acyl-homoserine-lactone synthase n=1 Tax=Pseudomonas sp. NA-150 TaxID=3367525 RepID=UPI0037CA36A6